MNKHTQGPWAVNEFCASGEVSEYHIFIEPNIAVIERKVKGSDQCDMADAQLLAAAPDLLEALKEARTGLVWYQMRHPESVDGSDDEAITRIDAAIAKAEGRA
jgi:hypothetical protein